MIPGQKSKAKGIRLNDPWNPLATRADQIIYSPELEVLENDTQQPLDFGSMRDDWRGAESFEVEAVDNTNALPSDNWNFKDRAVVSLVETSPDTRYFSI
jgi:hypothetical protein